MTRKTVDVFTGVETTSTFTWVPPALPIAEQRARMNLTFAQMLIGLEAEGWVTTAEAEAWLEGTLPAAVLTLIGTLPATQRFPARARAIKPSTVLRTDSLVAALAVAEDKTEAEIDTFFLTYAAR